MRHILLILLLLPSLTVAQTHPSLDLPKLEQSQEVLLRLRAIHNSPDKAELEVLSKDARTILVSVVKNGDGLIRERAISALATWKDREAWTVLAPLFHQSNVHELTKHLLMVELARNFQEDALPMIGAWLSSPDVERRRSAAQALAEVDHDGVEIWREFVLKNETDEDVLKWVRMRVK